TTHVLAAEHVPENRVAIVSRRGVSEHRRIADVLLMTSARERAHQRLESAFTLHVVMNAGRDRRHERGQRLRGLIAAQSELSAELLNGCAVLRIQDRVEEAHGPSLSDGRRKRNGEAVSIAPSNSSPVRSRI